MQLYITFLNVFLTMICCTAIACEQKIEYIQQNKKSHYCYLAIVDGKSAGIVNYKKIEQSQDWLLMNIVVFQQYRNKKIGSTLFAKSVEHIKGTADKDTLFRITAFPGTEPFFKKNGCKEQNNLLVYVIEKK